MKASFHPEARAEYVHALTYIDERRRGYGQKFEDAVFATLDRAQLFPKSGSRFPGLPSHIDLRVFPIPVFRYSLVIVFADENAVVLAVKHQHRKPGYWRERLSATDE